MSGLARIARKLQRIAASGLSRSDQFRYVLRLAGLGGEPAVYRFESGEIVALRKGTTDCKVFDEIFVERVYAPGLAVLPDDLEHVTLIDLGAYTGLSALFFARELAANGIVVDRIVAVEPDPGNFRMLSDNLRTSGLEGRCTALHAFAGAEKGFAAIRDSGNGAWGMRMGPASNIGTPVLPMAEIVAMASTAVVLKCDIEGGERELFLHLRDWEPRVRYILLELHAEFLAIQALRDCLESSAFHWIAHGNPPEGAVIAFFLLERGARREIERSAAAR